MEIEQSNKAMKAPRNPTGVFEILCKCFNEAIIFAAFSENNILAGYALNLLLNSIPKMGGIPNSVRRVAQPTRQQNHPGQLDGVVG